MASESSVLLRYRRAGRALPPHPAAEAPGATVEGYWIDENRFFFLAERFEPSLSRPLRVPSIAHCLNGAIEEILSPASIATLLSEERGELIELAELALASFDMPRADVLAVSVRGRDVLLDTRRRCVLSSRASLEEPALYSPDGRYACVVRGPNLVLKERESEAEHALTSDGEPLNRYGQSSDTGLAAVSSRRRPRPLGLWSPDSQWFLTHRIDDRPSPELALMEHLPPGGGRPRLHRYRYPYPGDALPVATYVAFHVRTRRMIAFPEFPVAVTAFSPFAVRRAWFSGATTVSLIRLDRYCRRADLIELDLDNRRGRQVLSEAVTSGYLDLHPIIGAPNSRTLPASDEVIWFSERDGWGHLYLYDASTGELKNQITRGDWLVRDVVEVDEERRTVLLLAGGLDPETDPSHRSLCSVRLDGSDFRVLESHQGDLFVPSTEPCGLEQDRPYCPSYARAGISPDGRHAVVRRASIDRGNITRIVNLVTQQSFPIASAVPVPEEIVPRPFRALAADGKTPLHGVMFLPSDFLDTERYPLIDYMYPGPQIMQQPQCFRSPNSGQARALAELGFITVMLNTRGMPGRSRAVHQAGYGVLLEPQLADHAAVVRQLCAQHAFIDAERIGVLGQSGGGAASARALFDYGDVFKVGVAVCGNHDSSSYAAVWSDKYRGPGDPNAWADQANASVAHQLAGRLLLISGELDENVHVSQTLAVVDALVRSNKDFDLLIVPGEGHAVLMTNGYVQRRTFDYFVQHLAGLVPPTDFALRVEPPDRERFLKRSLREYRE